MVGSSIVGLAQFIWNHPANAGRRARTIARSAGWQLYKRATHRSVDVRVADAATVRCYPDSRVASLLVYCNGRPDYHEMRFMERYLRPGDAFIDAGANVGVYTVLAAALVTPAGIVEAFEPDPIAALRLRENISLNQWTHVQVHEAAVGESAGVVRFLTGRDAENRIGTSGDDGQPMSERPCVKLDEWLTRRPFAMGKLDLEGAEPLALRGAEAGLAHGNPPVWQLEFNESMRQFGTDPCAFRDWLALRGFDLALYDADRRELCFEAEPWTHASNVLAISRAHRDRVKTRLHTAERA